MTFKFVVSASPDRLALDQTRHHGGRREHGEARIGLDKAKNLRGLEPPALGNDVVRALVDVRYRVQARAVGQGCGVQDAIVLRDRIDVGEIAQGHAVEVLVGEHGSLRPARRTARIEEPGQIIWRLRFDGDGLPGLNRPVFGGVDLQHAFERFDFTNKRRYRIHQVGSGEAGARARVFQDEGHLLRMELRVDGQSAAPCMPDGVEDLQKRRTILHGDGYAVPGRHPKIFPQVARHGTGPAGKRLIRAMNRLAI